ncbi:MAG: PqqD family protein [Chloroflexi bacterium]|nr:PqqD family protein [Chloroflexota bacterium]
MTIELNTRVVRAEGLVSRAVDQDIVILNLASDNYIALDQIGKRIWELLETPRRVDELCRQLSQEFAGTPEQIANDVLHFLAELESEQMVHGLDKPSA